MRCENCKGLGYTCRNDPTYIIQPNRERKIFCEDCKGTGKINVANKNHKKVKKTKNRNKQGKIVGTVLFDDFPTINSKLLEEYKRNKVR